MWQAQHQARYIDALENSLLNAVLAGISLDGQRFFYTNTLRQLDSMPVELRWSRQRESWISCYCCPPNVARILAGMQRLAYAYDPSSVWVLLYGSNQLQIELPDGSPLKLEQRSSYPQDGHVEIIVQAAPARPLDICLRIPGWCSQASLTRNGKKEAVPLDPGSFAKLKGTWAKGDRIVLDLEMPARLMAAHPLVEECRGQVAVQRGPLVYCLESQDLPQAYVCRMSLYLLSLCLNRANPPRHCPTYQSSKLSCLTTRRTSLLNIRALLNVPTRSSTYLQSQLDSVLRMGNRGPSEMTVWIPVMTP